jgi:hypothetical protein
MARPQVRCHACGHKWFAGTYKGHRCPNARCKARIQQSAGDDGDDADDAPAELARPSRRGTPRGGGGSGGGALGKLIQLGLLAFVIVFGGSLAMSFLPQDGADGDVPERSDQDRKSTPGSSEGSQPSPRSTPEPEPEAAASEADAEARRLIDQAQALGADGDYSRSLDVLREARDLRPSRPLAREIDTLLQEHYQAYTRSLEED